MSDLSEDLQIIKREYSSPAPYATSSEVLSDHFIKSKLNLHVKKRLQQDYEYDKHNKSNFLNNMATEHLGDSMTTCAGDNEEQKKSIRSRKPYLKRTGRNKLCSDITKERKSKYKLKQLVINKGGIAEEIGSKSNSSTNINAISTGDNDDGNFEDVRSVRDKEKCPDVLGMVLNMKKRALFGNSEVQEFLTSIIAIVKS